MNREEKAALIEEIGAEIESSEAIFAVDYRGISVTQAAELRNGLREADATFKVVKNRLTKIAAEKAGATELNELLQGPTALTFVKGDTAAAAKAITSFNKEHEILTYKGGVMGDTILDEGRFTAISKLPTRDVLNGQLAGIVASPLVTLTRGLGSMISGLAIALQQVADQGLVGGSAPEAEAAAPAEEAPAEETAAEEAPAEEATEAPAEEPAAEEAPAEEAPAEEAEAAEPAAEEAPADEAEASDEDKAENNEEAPADEANDGADENDEAPADEATDGADAKE
jgi:large subunit ribosomal protein L10